VNCEKEPVDGTAPDRLLFERSLQITTLAYSFITQQNHQHNSSVYATYRTWRVLILVKDSGI
jgi:hypothetical protein